MKAIHTKIRCMKPGQYEAVVLFWDDEKGQGRECFLYRGVCSEKHATKISQQGALDFNVPFIGEEEF